jgi:hypothetical protein
MTVPDYLREAARRAAMSLAALRTSYVSPVGDGGDDVLRASLEACAAARAFIPEELEKARELAAAAEGEIERAAYLWQGDVTRLQIETAARVAEERMRRLNSLRTEGDFERERRKCAADTLHWFRFYAWGYDPRAVLKVQPFYPFPRQEDYIRWLDDTVIRRRKSGVVEKARDMGATVGALDWTAHKWLFVSGFSAFLSSANEDLVDSSRDPDTLFEKIRFQLRLTPSWQLPAGFSLKRDMPYMNIVNPGNGATITGGAPTENVGRQRRATVVLADEFQAWPGGGFKQNTSLSQTAFSVMKLGTPYGALNQYYKDTHAEGANVFVMDWREHPWKSQAWYDSLPFGYVAPRMSPADIAQEVDRNYEASQPGRVWPQYSEPHTVITVSELRSYMAAYGIPVPDSGDGLPRVPLSWSLGRGNDRGATAGHRNAWLWCAAPKQGHLLVDSVFIFREWLAPLGSGQQAIAREVFAFEKRDRETKRADLFSLNSHEAEGERNTYRELGLHLRKWTTDYESGISDIGSRLELVETDRPHPFRPQLKGRPRLFFVVADGQGELKRAASGVFTVAQAKDSAGLVNLRRQVGRYHYPPEEEGKPAGQMRPRKIDDDCVDILRAFATHRWPKPAEMTDAEERDSHRPVGLRNADIAAITDHGEAARAHLSQMVYDAEHFKSEPEGRGYFYLEERYYLEG